MAHWRGWWRLANVEQAVAFALVTIVTIGITSMIAHATLFGRGDLPNGIGFLRLEGIALQARAGRWLGVLFWLIGALSLFTAAMGIVDYTSRLAADLLVTTYVRPPGVTESRLYFGIVWTLVGIGVVIHLAGADQPLVLLVISASVGGTMNVPVLRAARGAQPAAPRAGAAARCQPSVGWLAWATVFYGWLAGLTVANGVGRLWFCLLVLVSAQRSGVTESLIGILRQTFGWGIYVLPLGLIGMGLWLVLRRIEKLPPLSLERATGIVFFFFWLLAFMHAIYVPVVLADQAALEGVGGGYIGKFL